MSLAHVVVLEGRIRIIQRPVKQKPWRILTRSSFSRPSANQKAMRRHPMGRWGSQSPKSNFASELAGRGTDSNVNTLIKARGESFTYGSFADKICHMQEFSRVGINESVVPRPLGFILNLHWMCESQRSVVFGDILYGWRVLVMRTIKRIFSNRDSFLQWDRWCSRGNIIYLVIRITSIIAAIHALGVTNEEPTETTLFLWLKATFATAFAIGIPFFFEKYEHGLHSQ